MRITILLLLIFLNQTLCAQHVLKGVVADSATRQPLPFCTIKAVDETTAAIASIDGKFSINLIKEGPLVFSYSGHHTKTISSAELLKIDTVFLSPVTKSMEEVVIRSASDKVKRIVNAAIQNKPQNTPDQINWYQCSVYYKMIGDINRFGNYNMDSIKKLLDSTRSTRHLKHPKKDSATTKAPLFKPTYPTHLFITETYSRRTYKKPGQVQEVIVASKFSGLRKTIFANIITDILPFHVYTDYIVFYGIDYINPIANGWQSRYRFTLENEIVMNGDTVFMLSYRPKSGVSFNALTGIVYITSNGFAITHFTAANAGGPPTNHYLNFEQNYQYVAGKWLPQELNFTIGFQKSPTPYTQMVFKGHAVIDSLSFANTANFKWQKAHPLTFADSIDLHQTLDWQSFRKDTLSERENNTYKNLDTISRLTKMETFINLSARFATGRVPIGKIDVDVQRLFASNDYEGTRFGLGLYTNNKVSRYYSIGGWYGYGTKDKTAKYGASATLFPVGDKDNRLSFSYQKTYRLPGEVSLHPDLSKSILQNFLLQQIDVVKEYEVSAIVRPGYWEIRPSFLRQQIGPLQYSFDATTKPATTLTINEATVGVRYAYVEKRVPLFEYYLPAGTRYPIVYAAISKGSVATPDGYNTNYYRALMAATFFKHINRWGADHYRFEGGIIQAKNNAALPRSLLLAGTGYRRNGINFLAPGGFITMRPFAYYADTYASFLYTHDLDRNLWSNKWSKPYISLSHNMIYGRLQPASSLANNGVQSYASGYHETGLVLNRILKYSLRFTDINLNAGAYYHWQKSPDWNKNCVVVIGISSGL